jgi:hypothetical protein
MKMLGGYQHYVNDIYQVIFITVSNYSYADLYQLIPESEVEFHPKVAVLTVSIVLFSFFRRLLL